MPDSLQNIVVENDVVEVVESNHSANEEHSEEAVRSSEKKSETSAPKESTAPTRESNRPNEEKAAPVHKAETAEADTIPEKPEPRFAIVMTAHKEPEVPVSPRSVGSTTSSWVILGLIAVFMLVSMRYARNFKFLSGIGRELLAHQPTRRMFDDTVRETSFLIFLNILCIVSVGVLLFGGIELSHPFLRNSANWYSALGLVTLLVGGYYVWQWAIYYVVGNTFGNSESVFAWLRGFTSGNSFMGIALFPLALISIFSSAGLGFVVVLAAIIYIVIRMVFIVKGIRIFLPQSDSWLPFFYYLCAVEIAPVVLLIHLSTNICMSVAAP